jgi:hypothetical protein
LSRFRNRPLAVRVHKLARVFIDHRRFHGQASSTETCFRAPRTNILPGARLFQEKQTMTARVRRVGSAAG